MPWLSLSGVPWLSRSRTRGRSKVPVPLKLKLPVTRFPTDAVMLALVTIASPVIRSVVGFFSQSHTAIERRTVSPILAKCPVSEVTRVLHRTVHSFWVGRKVFALPSVSLAASMSPDDIEIVQLLAAAIASPFRYIIRFLPCIMSLRMVLMFRCPERQKSLEQGCQAEQLFPTSESMRCQSCGRWSCR